jgi:putative effector of murein hydrolase
LSENNAAFITNAERRVACGLTHRQLYLITPFWIKTNFENEESTIMLWAILVVLLLLWLVGFYGGFVTTSLIHLLLVAAVVVLALNLFKHRNPA